MHGPPLVMTLLGILGVLCRCGFCLGFCLVGRNYGDRICGRVEFVVRPEDEQVSTTKQCLALSNTSSDAKFRCTAGM